MQLRLPSGEYYGQTLHRRDAAGIVVVESQLAAGTKLPVHSHQNAYLCAVIGGSFEERAGSRTRTCGAATVKFHKAGEEHCEQFGRAGAHLVRVEIPAGWQSLDLDAMHARMRFDDENRALLLSLVGRMRGELRQDDDLSPLVVSALTIELIAAAQRRNGPAALNASWLTRVRERIADSTGQPPTLAELAADCGVHPVHMATMFRRRYGCTIGDYGRRVRVGRAAAMLVAGDVALSEIALATGFADQSHFSRVFRQCMGTTPAAFRSAARKSP